MCEGHRHEHPEKRRHSIVSSPDHRFPPFWFFRLPVLRIAKAGARRGNPSENLSKSPLDWQARQTPSAARSRAPQPWPKRSAPAPIVVLLPLLPFGFALRLLLLAPPQQLDILDA